MDEEKPDTKKTKAPRKKHSHAGTHPKYKPAYCQMLIEHMSQGFSFDSFPAVILVARSTMYVWFDEIPEFTRAREIADAKGMQFYENMLRVKCTGIATQNGKLDPKRMDTTALIFAMKCRFRKTYGEKQIVEHTGESLKVDLKYVKDAD